MKLSKMRRESRYSNVLTEREEVERHHLPWRCAIGGTCEAEVLRSTESAFSTFATAYIEAELGKHRW